MRLECLYLSTDYHKLMCNFETMEQEKILSIRDLAISFPQNDKIEEVVHQISFDLYKNEILAIVGESGSGKSITTLATLGLLDKKAIVKAMALNKTMNPEVQLL